jgi:hypothetical protein
MILFQNFYRDKNPKRNQELETCLVANCNNKFIEKVVLLIDGPHFPDHDHPKIRPYLMTRRPTYSDIFYEINTEVPIGKIVAFANSDIFFDETIASASALRQDECFALSRWDVKGDKAIPFHRADSQDVWIFRTPVIEVEANFTPGVPGCDNRIARMLKDAGYKLINPCKSIKAYHLHEGGEHNYSSKDRVPGPYHLIQPS